MSDQTMQRWKSIFSEETLVPLSLVILLIPGAFWLATVSSNANNNQAETTKLAEHAHESDVLLREIADRLARIEGKLDSLGNKRR